MYSGLVFLYHSYVVSSKYVTGNSITEQILVYFSHAGMIGVLLFFTISGFIMAYIIETGEKYFILKRFLRIYPIFILAVILIIFLKVLFFGAIKELYLPYALTLLPLEIMKQTSTLTPSYPLGIEWTLIFEVFFYFVISLFNNNYMKKYLLYFSFIWLIIIIVTYVFYITPLSTRVTYREIFFSLYNIPFIFGVLAFHLHLRIKKFKVSDVPKVNSNYFYIISIVFVVVSNILINLENSQFYRVLLISIECSLIIMTLVLLEKRSKKIKNNFFVKIGNYSYGIYLIHLGLLNILFSLTYNKLGININIMSPLYN